MRQVLRNERKFLINSVEFMKKRHWIEQFIPKDIHNGDDGYLVRSLYFDTAYDSDFFDKEHGIETRKKIRLRIYDPNSEHAFLEMKQKQGQQQRKRSIKISKGDAKRLIACDYTPLLAYNDPFATECYGIMQTRCYRPKSLIEYRRLAFVTPANNTRITFDYRIRASESSFDLFDSDVLMAWVLDHSQVVLEVKYTGFLLSYIKDMLSDLQRSELSVSKYSLARYINYYSNL